VIELRWNGSWHQSDLTSTAGAPAAAGDPTAYVFRAEGTLHVDYRRADGHIEELWSDGTWHGGDLTALAGAPSAASNPTGFALDADRSQHVFFRDPNGHVQELRWS